MERLREIIITKQVTILSCNIVRVNNSNVYVHAFRFWFQTLYNNTIAPGIYDKEEMSMLKELIEN